MKHTTHNKPGARRALFSLQSDHDAARIRQKGVQAVQINTDGGIWMGIWFSSPWWMSYQVACQGRARGQVFV